MNRAQKVDLEKVKATLPRYFPNEKWAEVYHPGVKLDPARFKPLGIGCSRVAYLDVVKDVVLKVPLKEDGVWANAREAHLSRVSKRQPISLDFIESQKDWHFNGYGPRGPDVWWHAYHINDRHVGARFARCRLVPGTFLLIMERVKEAPDADLPDWSFAMDCRQVGYAAKDGLIVAYDFGFL